MHSAPDTLTHFRASTCGDASRIGSGAGPLSAFSAVPSSAFLLRRLGFAAAFCSCSAFTSTACPAPVRACSRLATSGAACALLPGAPCKSGSALTCATLAAAARRRFGRTASEEEAKAAAVAARAACRPRFGTAPAAVLGMCALTAERSIKRAGVAKCPRTRRQVLGPCTCRVQGSAMAPRKSRSLGTPCRKSRISQPASRGDILQQTSCRQARVGRPRACLPSPC